MLPAPPPPPGYTRPDNPRFRKGQGQRYVPDVVERARVLIEGTELSYKAVAARTGIGVTTLHRWTHARAWTRPAGAAGWLPLIAVERAGLGKRFQGDLLEVARLADGAAARSTEPTEELASIAARARRYAAMHGRPGSPVRPRPHARPGDLLRLSAAPDPQGRIRDATLVETARRLVQGTLLKRATIAAEIGITVKTLSTWTQENGWRRPHGAPAPFGGQKPGRRGLAIIEARQLARDRLTAAERRLDALALSEDATAEVLAALLGALVEARDTLARRRRVRGAG